MPRAGLWMATLLVGAMHGLATIADLGERGGGMARAAFWGACGILIGYQAVLLLAFSRTSQIAFLDGIHPLTDTFLRTLPFWWAVPFVCIVFATYALARRGIGRGALAVGICTTGTLGLLAAIYGPMILRELS